MTAPRSSKTDRPAKRAQQTDAQRERDREQRRIEAAERREKERLRAIEERKAKDIEVRTALAEAGDYVEDFGMEGVFDENGNKIVEPHRIQLPALPAWQSIPLKGEHVDPQALKPYLSDDQRMVFLRQYASFGNAGSAAWEAGSNLSSINRLRELDPLFDAQFDEAKEVFRASIDEAVISRGRDGWREPVFSTTMGSVIGYKRVYDSQLLQMAAKRLLPEKYGDKVQVDHDVHGVLVIRGEGRPTEEEWVNEYAEQGAALITPTSPGGPGT